MKCPSSFFAVHLETCQPQRVINSTNVKTWDAIPVSFSWSSAGLRIVWDLSFCSKDFNEHVQTTISLNELINAILSVQDTIDRNTCVGRKYRFWQVLTWPSAVPHWVMVPSFQQVDWWSVMALWQCWTTWEGFWWSEQDSVISPSNCMTIYSGRLIRMNRKHFSCSLLSWDDIARPVTCRWPCWIPMPLINPSWLNRKDTGWQDRDPEQKCIVFCLDLTWAD